MSVQLQDIVLNTALAIPGVRRIRDARKTTTGANGTADPNGVMLEWSAKIRDALVAAGGSLEGANLVEVGPGHSLGVGFCLLLDGAASVRAIDVSTKCDPDDGEQFRGLAERWRSDRHRGNVPDVTDTVSKLSYALVSAHGNWPIESASVDCVYSFFAGEHLRNPRQTLLETRRVLRDGGVCLYAIDLTSHLPHQGNWLAHLSYSDRIWEAMTSRRGCWTNRLLGSDWLELFTPMFETVDVQMRRRPEPPGFDRERLAPRFREKAMDELLIDYVWLVGRKAV